ncbi:hypothetical protein RCL1_000447 [Eukaryota sp. TZLM3-RCL]
MGNGSTRPSLNAAPSYFERALLNRLPVREPHTDSLDRRLAAARRKIPTQVTASAVDLLVLLDRSKLFITHSNSSFILNITFTSKCHGVLNVLFDTPSLPDIPMATPVSSQSFVPSSSPCTISFPLSNLPHSFNSDFSPICLVFEAYSDPHQLLVYHFHLLPQSPHLTRLVLIKSVFHTNGQSFLVTEAYSSTGSNSSCVVCYDERVDICLLPCKHVCMCKSCFNRVLSESGTCPICRTELTGSVTFTG